jgi:hypothetical protein
MHNTDTNNPQYLTKLESLSHLKNGYMIISNVVGCKNIFKIILTAVHHLLSIGELVNLNTPLNASSPHMNLKKNTTPKTAEAIMYTYFGILIFLITVIAYATINAIATTQTLTI